MLSPAFTNTSISNAYRGADQVSKILLGFNVVWPQAPVFSFDTYQAGGELNFTVVSDTQYVACTVNDSDTFLFKAVDMTWGTDSSIQAINLDAQAYNKQYQLDSDTNVIDINLSLYQRKKVKITGRGSSASKYIADNYSGLINVEVENPFGAATVFTVSIPGQTSITKTCLVGSRNQFMFPNLPAGTKTVTINNLTDGVINTASVVLNARWNARLPTQTLNLGEVVDIAGGISENLTTIKVYSLTEEEASALLSDQVLDLTEGVFINNLLFNNVDLIGNLRSVDLKDINVNSISAITQSKLQVIRSKDIITSTIKSLNSNVKIINTPIFKSTHGPETTYYYLGAHNLRLTPTYTTLIPVGVTSGNYTFKTIQINPSTKDIYRSLITLRVYDQFGNIVSTNDINNPDTWDDTSDPGLYSIDRYILAGQTEIQEWSGSFGLLRNIIPSRLFIGITNLSWAAFSSGDGEVFYGTDDALLNSIEILSPPNYTNDNSGYKWVNPTPYTGN
jgi:hypothetical protein